MYFTKAADMKKFTEQKKSYKSCITTYTTICYYVLLLLMKAVLVANEATDSRS